MTPYDNPPSDEKNEAKLYNITRQMLNENVQIMNFKTESNALPGLLFDPSHNPGVPLPGGSDGGYFTVTSFVPADVLGIFSSMSSAFAISV